MLRQLFAMNVIYGRKVLESGNETNYMLVKILSMYAVDIYIKLCLVELFGYQHQETNIATLLFHRLIPGSLDLINYEINTHSA